MLNNVTFHIRISAQEKHNCDSYCFCIISVERMNKLVKKLLRSLYMLCGYVKHEGFIQRLNVLFYGIHHTC